MQFDVNYAWSHALGVQPNNSWTGAFNMFTMRNLRDSYGPTGFDYRHVIHANGTYDLPFGKGRRFAITAELTDKIVGGWSVGTIVNWQTGGPYQLLGGFNTVNGPTNTPVGDVYGDGGVNLNGVSLADLPMPLKYVTFRESTVALTINPNFMKRSFHPTQLRASSERTRGCTDRTPSARIWRSRRPLRFARTSGSSSRVSLSTCGTIPVWANPAGGYNSTSQGFIQNTSAPIQSATFGESSVVQADPVRWVWVLARSSSGRT